jgi:hypothetical protein
MVVALTDFIIFQEKKGTWIIYIRTGIGGWGLETLYSASDRTLG